jgi:two-component system chemotaxis response regulator CheB
VRYRCRVGHAWTGEGLVAKQSDILDDALWTALRSLEESVSLSRQLANRHRARGNDSLATRFERQTSEMEERADVIRTALMHGRGVQVTPDVGNSEGSIGGSRATGD